MSAKPFKQTWQYIVVENSGMIDERDVGKFSTRGGALAFLERTYCAAERDPESATCLFPAVCLEEDGMRTYDI